MICPDSPAQMRVGRIYRNRPAPDPTWCRHVSRKLFRIHDLDEAIGGKSDTRCTGRVVTSEVGETSRGRGGRYLRKYLNWSYDTLLRHDVGELSTVQFLLERGAIPTTRNWYGDTLLHNCVHCVRASRSVAKLGLLLEAGLNIEATNNLGETPLHYAAKLVYETITFSSCCNGGRMSTPSITQDAPLYSSSWTRRSASPEEDSLPAISFITRLCQRSAHRKAIRRASRDAYLGIW
jgi:hypothetical protein